MQTFIIRKGDEARRQNAVNFLSAMNLNRDMAVEVKEHRKSRSSAQNRMLWKWYGIIGNDVGKEPEELHEEMKVIVLGVERKIVNGIELIVPKSSTKLTVRQMTEFLQAVEMLASQLGIVLPRPEDYRYAMMLDENTAA